MEKMDESMDIKPLFIKAKDIPAEMSPYDICEALSMTIKSKLEGIQLINKLWHLYVKDKTTRLELCMRTSIVIHGKHVKLYDDDPFKGGQRAKKQLDKLTIRNLPLYVPNDEIAAFLVEKGISAATTIKYGLYRDNSGQFTQYKNGDRFLYVEPFNPPLAKQQTIANFPCLVLHHGKTTHCSSCGKPGHNITDSICEARTELTIYAFKGHMHPLSTHYPCKIDIYGKTFASAEQAYLYRMACDLSDEDTAEKIRCAKHAGEATYLSKNIGDDDSRWEWEQEHMHLMKGILEEKVEQCVEFKNCLEEYKTQILAAATPSRIWGSGLSPFVTENTAPQFWPGRNMLGAYMMELAAECFPDHQEILTSEVLRSSGEQLDQYVSGDDQPTQDVAQLTDDDQSGDVNQPTDINIPTDADQHKDSNLGDSKPRVALTPVCSTPVTDKKPSRGRPIHKSPPGQRASSTPSRRSSNVKDGKGSQVASQSIQTMFENMRAECKRKKPASSPEQHDVAKSKRTDRGVS